MVRGIVIPADSDLSIREVDVAKDGSVVADVVGGFMEAVDLPSFGATIYVNEEGLLRHLPLNSRATFLWWYHVPSARRRSFLVGDAVVTGLPDGMGADTDLPTTARDLLLAVSRFRVEVRLVGSSQWHVSDATYPTYWEAVVWAMLLVDQVVGVKDARVVTVTGHAPWATTQAT